VTLTADPGLLAREWRQRWQPPTPPAAWEETPGALALHITRNWTMESRQRQAPHLELIDNAFKRISAGSLKRLIITLPPRHGKSERASRWGALWYLRRHPDRRVVLASYGASLAEEHSQWVRDTIEAHSGQEDTEDLGLRVHPAKRAIDRWQLTTNGRRAPGGMVAVGVGGALTGRGADLLIIDDPVKNREDADSPTFRRKTWEWWTSTARTRLQPGGAVVVILTRWHEDDLAGRLLANNEKDQWEVLNLPAIAEQDDLLGRQPGEPLWPDQYDLEALNDIRSEVGTRDWLALYQQRPTAPEGAIWRWSWINDGEVLIGDVPQQLRRTVISVDPAGTAKDTSDHTGIVVMGQDHRNETYVFEDRSLRASPAVWGEAVWKAALDYGAAHILLEENYGQDMAENVLRSTWPGIAPSFIRAGVSPPRIERVNAQGSKYTRAVSASAMYESTALTKPKVHHVRGEHDLSLLEEELTGWIGTGDSPNRLDCVTQGVRWLMLGGDVRQAKQGVVTSGPRWGGRKVGHR
jgi:hypothetical protein